MLKLSCELPNLEDRVSLLLDSLERDMEDMLWLGIETEIPGIRKCPVFIDSGELDVDEPEKQSSQDLYAATNVDSSVTIMQVRTLD